MRLSKKLNRLYLSASAGQRLEAALLILSVVGLLSAAGIYFFFI
jgi:hypothetical protein